MAGSFLFFIFREKSILLYETKTYKEDLYEKFVFKT